jgi:hypothetical protein
MMIVIFEISLGYSVHKNQGFSVSSLISDDGLCRVVHVAHSSSERLRLVENMSMQMHYQHVYQLVSNGWKPGSLFDEASKTDPCIKHYNKLSNVEKSTYVSQSRAFLNALQQCDLLIEPLDYLENLYFDVACRTSSSTDHVSVIFQTFNAVCVFVVVVDIFLIFKGGSYSRAQIRNVLCGLMGEEFDGVDDSAWDPSFDLMLWAILRNLPDFAKYFWAAIPEHGVPLALIGSGLCRRIVEKFPRISACLYRVLFRLLFSPLPALPLTN